LLAKRLIAALVIVAALLPIAPTGAQTGNLLQNADFEGRAVGYGFGNYVTEGWTSFWQTRSEGMPAFMFHEPAFADQYGDRFRSGTKAMRWSKEHATFDAGIFQRVRLPSPTGKLVFLAWMTSWSGNDGQGWGGPPNEKVEHMVGIDPTGGTDFRAPTVLWSGWQRGSTQWQQTRFETEARGEWATVFMRSRNEYPQQRNATFVDDPELFLQASAPTPVPPTATPTGPPPPPTATPLGGSRLFAETGFSIADDAFWDYFNKRGGLRTFGYPVSRKFRLLGTEVQIFQRRIMQKQPNGQVGLLNVLDQEFMPYSSFNNAKVPPLDAALVATAPPPGSAAGVLEFVRRVAPDEWQGYNVAFQQAFATSVTAAEVGAPAALLPGFQLELWGIPTSAPQVDPGNANFVYQRWQRGVMHHDRATGLTQGLLLADYFKAILTGENLPADVASAAATSRFFQAAQRPGALPDTDFANAFVKE
jgi:hypothetical protein